MQLLILLVLSFCFSIQLLFAEVKPKLSNLNVGVILPLTGDYAQYGKELWRGIELANLELTQKDKGFNLFLEDGATLAASANISAATKLININKVKVLIVLGADDVGSIVGVTQRAGVAVLSIWDNSKELLQLGENVFSSGFKISASGGKFSDLALKELNLKTAAILKNNSTWSSILTESFTKNYESRGGKIVFNETVADNASDFKFLITKLKSTKPQLVFLPLSLPSATEAAIKQLQQQGVSVPIFAGEALIGSALEHLGSTKNDLYVSWPASADINLMMQYQKIFSEEAWDYALVQIGYQGAQELAKAFDTVSTGSAIELMKQHFGAERSLNRELAIHKIEFQGRNSIFYSLKEVLK